MIACSTRFGRDMLRGGLLAGMPRFLSLHPIPPSLPRPGARRRTSRPRSARASPRRPPGTCAPARASWSAPSVGRSRPQPSALQSASPSVSRFRLHRPFRQVGVASLIRVSKCRRVPCRRRGGRKAAAKPCALLGSGTHARRVVSVDQFAPPGSGVNIHDHT